MLVHSFFGERESGRLESIFRVLGRPCRAIAGTECSCPAFPKSLSLNELMTESHFTDEAENEGGNRRNYKGRKMASHAR
jgi:hypothetical protein